MKQQSVDLRSLAHADQGPEGGKSRGLHLVGVAPACTAHWACARRRSRRSSRQLPCAAGPSPGRAAGPAPARPFGAVRPPVNALVGPARPSL